jgi:gliding motility-associated-like protein
VAYSGDNCLSTSSQTITLKATPEITFAPLPKVCADVPSFQLKEASLTNNLPGAGIYSGTGVTPIDMFDPSKAGAGKEIIRYTFTGTNGCINYKEQTLEVYPLPTINAGPDLFLLEGGSTTLAATATGTNLTYNWTPAIALNKTNIAQPTANPINDTRYKLTVSSADGCTASDDVMVTILKTPVIPNTFSPNGDRVHDTWVIPYLNTYPGATVDLFNRYGQAIFHSVGYNKPWDGTYKGKQVPVGTYYYVIDPKNGRKQMAGFIDIIR